MLKVRDVLLLVLFVWLPLAVAAEDDTTENLKPIDSTKFVEALNSADAIFIGRYLQGGHTKARIHVVDSIVGTAKDDVIVTGLQNEVLRNRQNMPKFKKNALYLYITSVKGNHYAILPYGITIPMMGNKLTFSFVTPYHTNFWQPIGTDLVKAAISAIREKKAGMLSNATMEKLNKFFTSSVKKGDKGAIKTLLAVARYLSLRLPEELYTPLTKGDDTVACIAVKLSALVMGELYFTNTILPEIQSLPQDSQVAAAYAAIDADSKESSRVFGKLLNTASTYQPASSECFPQKNPLSNRAMFVTAIIEVNAPDSHRILQTQLESGDAKWLSVILHIISEYEGADLIELVLAANAKEKYSERQLEFSNYFTRIKSPKTADILIKLFDKNDSLYWKKIILTTLGGYEYKESTPFLIKVMNTAPREEIRIAAAMALGQLNQEAGVKPLFDFIMREKSLLAKSIAIDALAKINHRSVQDYLKKIIKLSKAPKIREDAANALEDNLFILRYGRKKK